jgi:hypothetical protein
VGANPALGAAFGDLKAWGDKRVNEPLNVPVHRAGADGVWDFPDFKRGYQDASGKWNWEWKFNTALQQRSADVSNLGILYAITGDEKYAAYAKRILLELADAYGNGQGGANANGRDHFEAFGFDGGDAGMLLAKACNGYDLIYNALSVEDRTRIERDLIRPLAEHLKAAKFMYTGHGRWDLVCLYGIFISGIVLEDQALVDPALYGLGGTKEKITGGFLSDFGPATLRDGVIWGGATKADDRMASVAVMTTVAEVMRHRGVDLYGYQGRALKKAFDAAISGTPTATLVGMQGVDAFWYAYRHYQDESYLAVVWELKPGFGFAIGEHLPVAAGK